MLHHRPANESDFAALHRLYNLERDVNHQIGWDATDEEGFRAIFDEMVGSGEQFVVCGSDGGVIGAYRVHRFNHRMRHVAHIASVGLMGAHQGKGIGRRMMEGIIERLRGEGIKRIELTVAVTIRGRCGCMSRWGCARGRVPEVLPARRGGGVQGRSGDGDVGGGVKGVEWTAMDFSELSHRHSFLLLKRWDYD
ncbi:MAG: GNAT family N-acetyltransferase [Phycisphaerales bacterium]